MTLDKEAFLGAPLFFASYEGFRTNRSQFLWDIYDLRMGRTYLYEKSALISRKCYPRFRMTCIKLALVLIGCPVQHLKVKEVVNTAYNGIQRCKNQNNRKFNRPKSRSIEFRSSARRQNLG